VCRLSNLNREGREEEEEEEEGKKKERKKKEKKKEKNCPCKIYDRPLPLP
jgi:hypothetical protein